MKIIVLTVNHVYANKILKDLIATYGTQIKLIIEPSTQLKNKSNFQTLAFYLKTSGFSYVINQLIKLQIYRQLSSMISLFGFLKANKFFSYKSQASNKGIKVISIANINSIESIKLIRKQKPDLVISVLFSQILKEPVIRIPKLGVINVHPAYLPDYKGISPIFWSIVNKEKYSGISVHYINKGIDTGEIIKRKKVEISKTDTEDSLYWRCVEVGSTILSEAIEEIANKKTKTITNKGGRYFSFPTRKAVKEFRSLGRYFFRFKEYVFG